MSDNPNTAAREMAAWAQDLEGRAERYQDLHGRMAGLSVTETSRDGAITVTIDNTGVPTDLHLAESARGRAPAELATQIMRCLRRAQAILRHEVEAMVMDTVGEDDTGTAVIDQYARRFPDPELAEPQDNPGR
ncbi:YbaB/EbfC family nucleoid-associated protein [Nocardia sp. NEAU-G5]|uniref:YbaB/EbfC family nucleoid-associated protein n=1 Tax=Nocardia albiluteola TaxID=2842303 RepID=A0ABS6AUE4_9NOCA|nr:YbaB/EbfC family nucleoid-associated protein [Nocardia albiluteola]MBU3061644.1 YbaB/EbfC family nucleoid-associated protein [Nocardia albiluteola]